MSKYEEDFVTSNKLKSEREMETEPSSSFMRYDVSPHIEKLMGKGYLYNLEGLSIAERMALFKFHSEEVEGKAINGMKNHTVVRKTYQIHGKEAVASTYGKFWKRLREQTSPGETKRQARFEAIRRKNRSEARHIANTMLFRNKKYFNQLSKLI